VGKLATGVDVAKEHIGDGIAALRAVPPGLQDGWHVVFDPRDGQRPGMHQHHHRPGIRGIYRADQFLLTTGQGKARAIAPFRLDGAVRADIDEGNVGGARQVGGLTDGFVRLLRSANGVAETSASKFTSEAAARTILSKCPEKEALAVFLPTVVNLNCLRPAVSNDFAPRLTRLS